MIGIIIGAILVVIFVIIFVWIINTLNKKKDKYYLVILKNEIFNDKEFTRLFKNFSNKYHETPIDIYTINSFLNDDDTYICLLVSDNYKLLDDGKHSWNLWGYNPEIYNEHEFQNLKNSGSYQENYHNYENENNFNLIIMKNEMMGIDYNFQILSNISKKYCESPSSMQYFKNEYHTNGLEFILLIYGNEDILLNVQKELESNYINSYIKTSEELDELVDDSNNYEINNAYKILELDKNASLEEIKSAYRRLAKKYHPDLNKSANAEEMFRKINSAYNLLLEYSNNK